MKINVPFLQIDRKSASQGFDESRLPHFTEEEKQEIMGSSDFLGLNHYTSRLVYPTPDDEIDPSVISWQTDAEVR